jgi:hypothetical protein
MQCLITSFNYKIWNCYSLSTVAYFVATGDAATTWRAVNTDHDPLQTPFYSHRNRGYPNRTFLCDTHGNGARLVLVL